MEVSGQLHAWAAEPLRKQHPVPTGLEAEGPRNRSGRYGEEISLLSLQEIETDSSVYQATVAQSLYRLSYLNSSSTHHILRKIKIFRTPIVMPSRSCLVRFREVGISRDCNVLVI